MSTRQNSLKISFKFRLIFLLMLFSPNLILAQIDVNSFQPSGLPVFHYDIVEIKSPQTDLNRLYVYIKTAYDELTFVKQDSFFRAQYDISVVIADKDNYQVDGKTWSEEIITDSYENTNSRSQFNLTFEKFELSPAEFKVTVVFTDLESQKTRTEKKEVKLQDYEDEALAISDLMFVNNLVIDSLGVKSFTPEIADYIIDGTQKVFGYFEIYSQLEDEKNYEIEYSIHDAKRKSIYKDKYKRRSDGVRTLEYLPLAISSFPQGKYELRLKIKQNSQHCETRKNFFIRWSDMPSTIYDIDLAINQLKYIAEKEEWVKLRKTNSDEKLNAFKNFWKKRDPSPGTTENEWLDEYYNRIAYTNAHFSGFREGWKSDMGMIFIIFGPPSDIERHPFESGSKPFEIWYYYSINKQFVFMDETGFGEYRLLTQSWEDWRRLIRN